MKLSSTNKKCLLALEAKIIRNVSTDVRVKAWAPRPGESRIGFYFDSFNQNRCIKISKGLYENAMLVNVDSLTDLVELETQHRDFVILYPFDKMAYVRKIGKEVAFIIVDFTANGYLMDVGNYNFISGDFYPEGNLENKKELLRILIYLFHGDIEERYIEHKKRLRKNAMSYILNDGPQGVFFADSLWKQRISVSGFKVRGHFRLQPHGEKFTKRKLIWIDEFAKKGYNRRATREICKSDTKK